MNHARFGYYAVGTIQFKVDPEVVGHALEYSNKMRHIHGAWRLGKSSDVMAIVGLKDIEELDQVKEALKKLPTVSGLITNVWTGIRNIPENLALIPLKKKAHKADASPKKVTDTIRKPDSKIDETDIKIVEELAKNGRVSFRKIAEDTNSSTNTVARRYEKLKRNGTIKVSIQINPIKIGYRAMAFFNITFLAQTSISTVVETIAKIPDVTTILKTSGAYDLTVKAMIKDIDQLLAIQDEITGIAGVTKVEIYLEQAVPVLLLPREYISTF
jgi:Lrp/AsnC family transcriptional regulator for asnA, asnC and gidA